jgi:hypothetical protein
MKLKVTIPIATIMLAVAIYAVSHFSVLEKTAKQEAAYEEDGHEELEKAMIEGQRAWMFEMMKNPTTGRLDFEDIYEGRRQVEAVMKNPTRGGGLGLEWDNMGPNNVGGRTRAIVIDPTNPNRMYAGGVSGGVFITDNAGLQWYSSPGNETLGSLLISSMVRTANGDLYIGTGEDATGLYDGTASFTHMFTGDGVYKSTDEGQSWTSLSATQPSPGIFGASASLDWAYVYRLAGHPTDGNAVVAGHNGGIQYSTDGGTTWAFCSGGPTGTLNNNAANEVVWDSEGYIHSIYGNRYYRSVSAADPYTLDLYGEGLPVGGIGRIVLAVAPSDNNYVYAYIANSSDELLGIFRSTDRGINFSAISPEASSVFNPPGQQGYYNLCIAVNPSDKDRVYIGGQLDSWTWKASSGAWTPMSFSGYADFSPKYIHADHHIIVCHPTDPNIMFMGTDGGITRTGNALDAYPDFAIRNKGYDVTQLHGVSVGFYGEALAGTQDNGSPYVNFLGNSALESTQIVGGDGGRGEISKIRPEYLFGAFANFAAGSANGATIRRSVNGGSTVGPMYDPNIDNDGNGSADTGGEFVAEFKMWENWELFETFRSILDEGTIEYPEGSGVFYEIGDVITYEGREVTLTRSGLSESRFVLASGSNVWITKGALFNSTENPTWVKLQAGATLGVPTAFEFSGDGDMLYVGTSAGRLYRFEGLLNATLEYSDLDGDGDADDYDPAVDGITQYLYPGPFGSRITGISVDKNDPDNVAVSRGGYGVDDNVFHSSNALSNDAAVFNNIASGLPNIPVFDVLIHSYDNNWIIAATEFGVWSYNLASVGEWAHESSVIGVVPVFEIREDWIRDTDCRAIYIGTHGRGYFRATNLAPGDCNFAKENDIAVESGPIQEEIVAGIVIAPNPTNEYAEIGLTLLEAANVNISVYNMVGNKMMDVVSGAYPAGTSRIGLNVKDLDAGNYLVVFMVDGILTSRKITVL